MKADIITGKIVALTKRDINYLIKLIGKEANCLKCVRQDGDADKRRINMELAHIKAIYNKFTS